MVTVPDWEEHEFSLCCVVVQVSVGCSLEVSRRSVVVLLVKLREL